MGEEGEMVGDSEEDDATVGVTGIGREEGEGEDDKGGEEGEEEKDE
jgi:hypothetical protein